MGLTADGHDSETGIINVDGADHLPLNDGRRMASGSPACRVLAAAVNCPFVGSNRRVRHARGRLILAFPKDEVYLSGGMAERWGTRLDRPKSLFLVSGR